MISLRPSIHVVIGIPTKRDFVDIFGVGVSQLIAG
jgi:hypothetical protein